MSRARSDGNKRGIFANLSLFSFLSFARRGVFYAFMINYLYDLMHTVTYTAMLGTFNMMASTLGQNLVWGKLADRHHLRAKLIIAGESIAAGAYALVFLTHRYLIDIQADFTAGLSLIIGLSFLEFFWSMSDVGWSALVTDTTTTQTRGSIVGALNFISSLGRMIGIFFSGYLYAGGDGFRQGTIFYIVIAMLLSTAMVMWITSKRTREGKLSGRPRVISLEKKTHEADAGKNSLFHWFLLSLIVIVVGATCVSQVFLLFLKLPTGLNAGDAQEGYILMAWTIGGMLTSIASGWLADRFGRIRVMLFGLILAIATPLMYTVALDVVSMTLVYGLNGVAFWTIQTVGFALAGDKIPENQRGKLLSRYNAVMALSWGPAGLIVGGPLADAQTALLGMSQYMAYANTFIASALLVALGTILFALKVGKPQTSMGTKF